MRKTEVYTVAESGRDFGKMFLLTEMPAMQAEEWAMAAFLALAKSGVEVPDDVLDAGIAGLASFGLKSLTGLSMIAVKPLLAEMMSCVKAMPDKKNPQVVRGLVESDIEEVVTLTKLRIAVFKLHVNFSQLGNQSKPPLRAKLGAASEAM